MADALTRREAARNAYRSRQSSPWARRDLPQLLNGLSATAFSFDPAWVPTAEAPDQAVPHDIVLGRARDMTAILSELFIRDARPADHASMPVSSAAMALAESVLAAARAIETTDGTDAAIRWLSVSGTEWQAIWGGGLALLAAGSAQVASSAPLLPTDIRVGDPVPTFGRAYIDITQLPDGYFDVWAGRRSQADLWRRLADGAGRSALGASGNPTALRTIAAQTATEAAELGLTPFGLRWLAVAFRESGGRIIRGSRTTPNEALLATAALFASASPAPPGLASAPPPLLDGETGSGEDTPTDDGSMSPRGDRPTRPSAPNRPNRTDSAPPVPATPTLSAISPVYLVVGAVLLAILASD